MTIYDKGLIRAMKAAYRDSGYDVAVTDYFRYEHPDLVREGK